MNIDGIEQGISLYSFNREFVTLPDYTIEDALDDLVALDVQQYELVGSVFFEHYPRPDPAEVERVLAASEVRGVTPFSYGGYMDVGRITGHDPGPQDYILDLTADLRTARELGCRYLRETNIPIDLLPMAAEFADYYGVNIGIEVHAPSKPSDRHIQEQLEAFERIGSERLGFIPDFGCFIERPAAPALDRHIAAGADPELLEYIIANRHSGLTEDQMHQRIREMGGGEAERVAIAEFFGFLSFGPADLDGFTTLLDRTHYFHSKFYYVTEELEDPTIPMPALLSAIVDSGFQGVLMSEYEGHAFQDSDAPLQLARHLRLEQQILSGSAKQHEIRSR
ncbi:TIM barrel protein [Agromyces bracchium]|uniref:Xylose isomerase-like TIM barrel domain-containing protein n=1 Tax=Agromyces bracchium TaxID=88376 RepID=A0A6I3MD10_9MICO|nr:hypothetical protein [Agromyces bracchium]MTH70022.1 hypothetical protein [Agromyces bracchium]